MATITAPGLGSGLDINALIASLLAAEAQAPTLRLNTQEARLQVRLSGYGIIMGSISALQSSLSALNDISTYRKSSASSSDTDVLVASTSGQATTGSYDITVTTLAESHKLVTDTNLAAAQFTSVTDTLSTGSITFKFGTTTFTPPDTYSGFVQNNDTASATVTITDSSLQGIRDSINQADIGATASIIFDGTYFRLVISSDKTGADNSIQITVSDDDGNDTDAAGLSLLAFNASATHAVQTDAAADAAFSVNGIDITSESNTITTAIENVSLTLKKASSSATLNIDRNENAVSAPIISFVSAYNAYIDTVSSLTAFDPDTLVSGTLNGDSIVRGISSSIRTIIGNPIGDTSEVLRILADIGITTDPTTGRLNTDTAILDKQLNDNFDRFIELFAAFGVTTNGFVNFSSSTSDTKEGTFAVNVTQLATKGNLVGSTAANTTISVGSNDTLDITIDGISATITLTAGNYSASSLIAEVQSKINTASEFSDVGISVSVSESAGVLTITSQQYGSDSTVDITGGNGQTDLVGGSATKTDGVNVAGTIDGIAATGTGQKLTASSGNSNGLGLLITGVITGDLGTVEFKRGYADTLNSYLDSLLDSDGIFSSTSTSIQSQIDNITDDREVLQRRLDSIEARLRKQFIALDILIAGLQNTSTFLTAQLAALPKIGVINRSN